MQTFLAVQAAKVKGVLSGFDRVRLRGTLRMLANAKGMCCWLRVMQILLKDFRAWSIEITERIKRAAAELAGKRQRPVIYLASCHTNKEALAKQIAQQDGITAGLVCVLTCVESCQTFQIHKNREAQKLELLPLNGRCLHQYFYVIHPLFGWMQLRVQTWAPFTVHVNINGREWLATQLRAAGIDYEKRENCFVDVADVAAAQALLDAQLQTNWAQVLGDIVREYHPTHAELPLFDREPYYWSADETEWATDVMFRSPEDLAAIYPSLVRHAVTDSGCQNVLHYLGRPGSVANYRAAEITTSVLTRHEETRCKHSINGNSIKMYDKQESVLRIETTINNPREMKVYRTKESDPLGPQTWQRLRKGVADLYRRAELSQASNERYLADLATVSQATKLGDTATATAICRPTTRNGRKVRGLNPFAADDSRLLTAINRGEFAILGFRNRDIKQHLLGPKSAPSRTKQGRCQSTKVTRWLTLLRSHQLIQKVPRTHRYTLTDKGREFITAMLAAQQASTQQLIKLAT